MITSTGEIRANANVVDARRAALEPKKWLGLGRTTRRVPSCQLLTAQTALREEHGLSEVAAYLKSERMLWLFWLAIDSACTPSCC